MSLKSIAEEYFSNLNSIATRLQTDLEETKSSYEDLWTKLSEKEQQQILSESIIKPEISVKYSTTEEIVKPDYAVKLIFEDHCSYRDEHSGPFSFKTRSQRDLSIFKTDKPKEIPERKVKAGKPKLMPVPFTYQEPKLICEEEILDDDASNTLPKTGLDFLDNW